MLTRINFSSSLLQPAKIIDKTVLELKNPENKIKGIHISNVAIGNDGLQKLATALQSNTTVEKLSLGKTGLDEKGAIILSNLLAKNKTIKELDVRSNALGNQGAKLLLNSSLQKLDLSANQITSTDGFQLSPTLQTLNLSFNFAKPKETTPNAKSDAPPNNAKPADSPAKPADAPNAKPAAPISFSFLRSTALKALWLQKTDVTIKDIKEILKNTKLERLSISDNRLNDDDIHELVPILAQYPSLQYLWLQRNSFTTKGLEELSTLQSPSLESIYVANNEFTNEEFWEFNKNNTKIRWSRANQTSPIVNKPNPKPAVSDTKPSVSDKRPRQTYKPQSFWSRLFQQWRRKIFQKKI